ncbi:uroporphyrinogen-III synthase [Ramlibacter henchirensis]|uniref:Uroporphyrinogen-III synthase n=1 Tax=Ramlibacter henchirensis TaxID=204072 RepID=A0A4Z0BWR5_9BURK|nr:uroporphyrinogen-III synthase [Ramlibacter henchirensis]TFZ02475.1 uroporphyrinogen-III synthase [Ramlibacter henchirensis]
MRVVLTRPRQEASRWEQALRAQGHDVLLLPLIEIGPAHDAESLQRAGAGLTGYDAVMFVSGSAVHGFSRDARLQAPWPAGTRAWCTGPGTAQALLAAGVPANRIDSPSTDAAQFDSETLWTQVAAQVRPGFRVLLVRGAGADGRASGRDWLASQLQAANAEVDTVVAYTRRPPVWSDAERATAAAAAEDGSIWLFSSSEAIANLLQLLPHCSWSRARALATHERIAQSARDAGFGVVCLSRPAEEAVIATLESS